MYVSVFELYRIGPGPSSSYTVGPQRAAQRFVHDLEADGLLPQTARVEVELYGGLAFHGREHGSDRAVVAGLAGHAPERCDAASLETCSARVATERSIALGGRHVVRFDPAHDFRLVVDQSVANDGNAVRFLARNLRGDIVAARLYFSTGGGAVLSESDAGVGPRLPHVPYPFSTAAALLDAGIAHGKRICDVVRANECSLFSPGELRAGLMLVAQSMRTAVERGLTTEGKLPGGRRRTAPSWADGMRAAGAPPAQMCAVYATAMAEENALGGRVVAAPSAGAAGPVAALLQFWRDIAPVHQLDRVTEFLLAGAAIGGLLRTSGVRNVGCQGEVGVAAAMAAAGFASVSNGSNAQVVHAAELALAPHLGLTCDPVGARIEDPCIERNAMAATRAYTAATTAIRLPSPRNGLDVLARSMVHSGHVMSGRYKSASIGGVAVNVAEC